MQINQGDRHWGQKKTQLRSFGLLFIQLAHTNQSGEAIQPNWLSGLFLLHYKEFTPQGQSQGWGFCRDFAQPSQAVQDGTAVPDTTKGLPPAGACNNYQASSARCQILLARGQNHLLWQHREKNTHFSFKCPKCEQDNFMARGTLGALSTKKSLEPGYLTSARLPISPSLSDEQRWHTRCVVNITRATAEVICRSPPEVHLPVWALL